MPENAAFVGIMLVGADVQSEGVDTVLSNVTERARAQAVAVGATVAEPAPDGQGVHQPPLDGGASVRVFDRPLWGRRSLWMESAPAWVSGEHHYRDSPYQPRAATTLTHRAGPVLADFLRIAGEAQLRTYLQLGAISPPGLREEDLPRLPDGAVPDSMVRTGSLASPAVRAWNRARAADVLDAFPDLTGLRLDYVEDPCYKLPEAFTDFGSHAEHWSIEHGFDFQAIRRDVGAAYDYLQGGVQNSHLRSMLESQSPVHWFAERFPGLDEWLSCKGALASDLLGDWCEGVRATGRAAEVAVNAFAPPFSALSGFDAAAAARLSASVSPKLYAMHWSMMVEFWARELLARNPGLDEELVVRLLVRLGDLADDDVPATISDYGYPAPDEPHPVPDGSVRRKIDAVDAQVGDAAPVYPIVHGYGPLADFRRRLHVVADSGAEGVWINRYGYLSDEKLDAIGEIFGGRQR